MPPSYYAPEPGAPYTAEEVRVQTKEGDGLAGTLTIPSNISPPFPAVVLISGSGPSDRDMMRCRDRLTKYYRPFWQIADAFSRRGLAALRMDDRGVGCSDGGDIKNAIIHERADDIRAGIDFLRGRDEIDGHRLGLLGISEGGSIGPLIAASDPSIRALAIMAGCATNGWKILEYQCRYEADRNEEWSEKDRERICAEKWHIGKQWPKKKREGVILTIFLSMNRYQPHGKSSVPY